MSEGIIRILLAFIEGFALIISPCILPILPIMLSASLTGKRSRPFGIICGFVITFTLFTLFSRVIFQALHLAPESLRIVSFAILILLGLILMSDYLSEKFNSATNRLLNFGGSLTQANNQEGGFLSGILFGSLVGIIWTPCAGPILAAIIVQVISAQNNVMSVLTVVAFAIGAGVPMLLIALFGRGIMQQFSIFKNHAGLVRKILGLIIIASVIAMIFIPADYFASAPVENTTPQSITQNTLLNGLETSYAAPDITGIDEWINSPPLTIAELKGKVVLIDFWTYSCINCIRTLPYLKDWYAKYHDQGLEIIGVHSPEFLFEHNIQNVKSAVLAAGIKYPVAIDNNFKTWQSYQNQYWPAHYLINKDGQIVYIHFGEGEYDVTENNIRYLLGINTPVPAQKEQKFSSELTPETYLGYSRMENFTSLESITPNRARIYSYPVELKRNDWALRGSWTITPDKVISATENASIKLHYFAANVYAVMGASQPTIVNIVNADKSKQITVDEHKLYTIIESAFPSEATVEMTCTKPGVEIYTFTFG